MGPGPASSVAETRKGQCEDTLSPGQLLAQFDYCRLQVQDAPGVSGDHG